MSLEHLVIPESRKELKRCVWGGGGGEGGVAQNTKRPENQMNSLVLAKFGATWS